jgi:hypothetical protein
MLDTVNGLFNAIFSLLLWPFKNLHPIWGMLVISFVTGIAMLFIFKATSDQSGIKRAKNLVKGHFLAIRLYGDDIGMMFDTMKNIVLSNLLYMKKSLRPMLFLLVPVGIILIQLGSRYEFRPFQVGETIVVALQVDDLERKVKLSDVHLEVPAGLTTDMPPVRIDQLREVNWRIKAEKPGTYRLVFKYNGQTVEKRLEVVKALVAVAPSVTRASFFTTLLNPAETSISEAAFASMISVLYPKRDLMFWGCNLHWLVAFFGFSIVAAFSFKGVLGVEV